MKDVRFEIRAKDKTRAVFNKITRGLKRVKGSVFSLKNALFSLKGAFATTLGVVGFGFLVKQSLDATDKIGKLSKMLGIASKDLATFDIMARLGGTTLDTFASASKDVSKNVFEFVVKGTGEAVDGFKALGITATDLRPIMNDQVAVMGLVADKLLLLPDGATKTALAMKILGGSAAELLPALAAGSDSFRAARLEAEQLGIALSGKAVKGVEDANDAITRLMLLFRGGRDQLVAGFAPAIMSVADLIRNQLQNALRNSGLTVETWARGIVLRTIEMVKGVLKSIQTLVNGTSSIIDNITTGLKRAGLIEKTDQERAIFLLEKKRSIQNELFVDIRKQQAQIKRAGLNEADSGRLDALKARFVAVSQEIRNIEGLIAKAGDVAEKKGPFSDEALKKAFGFLDGLKQKTKEAFGGSDGAGNSISAKNSPFAKLPDIIDRARDRVADYFNDAKDGFKQMQDFGLNAFKGMESAFVNFVQTGKISFKSLVNSMIADLARMAAKNFISKLFGGGGILGGLFKGVFSLFGFAGGGRPPVGRASVVGERGPELFVPDTAGTIIPNHKAFSGGRGTGGGTTVINNINIDARQATDPAAVAQIARAAILEAAPALTATSETRFFDTLRRPTIA